MAAHLPQTVLSSRADNTVIKYLNAFRRWKEWARTCPIAMVERYVSMASISLSSDLQLFRGIVHAKAGERLRDSGSLSYTRVRELFLTKLTSLGYDAKQFGLHSLRSGGASAAANAGVPDRLFKRHGRWRSETAKDSYFVVCV